MNKKFWAVILAAAMLFSLSIPFGLSAYGAEGSDEMQYTRAIKTLYPTKDYVISDFIVTAYGAKTVDEDPAFDNRTAFQAAINAAEADGGGVVYIPAGHYAFRSMSGTGNNAYTLNLPASVQLRGDWADPEKYGGEVLGTVLEVYAGRGATNNTHSFIRMNQGTGVTNLSIWYPEQTLDNAVRYPWSVYQASGDSATVENVTFVNSWGGFYAAPAELHYVINSYITALNTGIEIHTCTDIGRVENVKIDPKYWAGSGLPGAPSLAEVTAYTKLNASGFKMHRSDWEYLSDLYISGYKTGMWVGREPSGSDTPNAQFYRMHMENCGIALEVDAVNGYGLLISDSIFGAEGEDCLAVSFSKDFSTSVQFSGVDFKGPIVSNGAGGVISFEGCTFDDYGTRALSVNSGNVLLTQCEFKQPFGHAYLGASVNTFKSLNSGYGENFVYERILDITDESGAASITIETGAEYEIEPIPRNIITDIDVYPKPASDIVLRVDLARVKGATTTLPSVDVSAQLQAALDEAAEAGGGTVYLPGGRYLVNSPLIIPTGVELRGSWDVQHHTQGGGVVLFTRNGITGSYQSVSGAKPFIQLQEGAGIKGLTIYQLGQRTGTINAAASSFVECPFLIQGQGADVYIINITFPNADKGIDLATYKTDRHYVEYFGGSCARAGIWIGGGSNGGFIRNWQGNPHYCQRLPAGNWGMVTVNLNSFQRSNYSAIKVGDVTNETIFFNFVFGSRYGIHYVKDAVTGSNPKEITVIGHGTDGSSYGMFVENADADTKIVMINSELVTISSTDMAYVLMGQASDVGNPNPKVDPNALLVMYNSAFWGSATNSARVFNGNVRLQQTNFCAVGNPSVVVSDGSAHVYTSYFQQATTQAFVGIGAKNVELTNNYYNGGIKYSTEILGAIFGSDIMPFTLELIKAAGADKQLKLTHVVNEKAAGGTLKLVSSAYAGNFVPVRFDPLAFGESLVLDLPYYQGGGPLNFELLLDSGRAIKFTLRLDASFADRYDNENSIESGNTPFMIIDSLAQVGEGPWDGPNDLSMTGNVKWDETNLYLYLVVTDDEHRLNDTSNIWQGDGIQVAVNIDKSASDGGQTWTSELGFALATNSSSIYTQRWAAPTGGGSTGTFTPAGSAYAITRDETFKTTTYDIQIPWSSLSSSSRPVNFNKIGMTILVNDSDSGQPRLAMEYGIGLNLKSYPNVADLYLMSSGQYADMLAASAWAAVEKACFSMSKSDYDMALNFITVVKDDEVKADLKEKLKEVTTAVVATEYDLINALAASDADITDIVIGANMAINGFVEIAGKTITIKEGVTLDIYGTAELGSVLVNRGLINVYGTLVNNGMICNEAVIYVYGKFINNGGTAGEYVAYVSASPSAYVEKLNGNKNNLTIKITENFSDGNVNIIEATFSINNNAADTYQVGMYKVYVDTKGNTQIRQCYILK